MTEKIGQHDIAEEVIAAQDQLYRLAYKLTGNRDDANDLTQDTLLKVLQHICGFRGEAALKTWLTNLIAGIVSVMAALRWKSMFASLGAGLVVILILNVVVL